MNWHECEGCESEFRVITDDQKVVEYCPFCSEKIEVEEEIEEDLDE